MPNSGAKLAWIILEVSLPNNLASKSKAGFIPAFFTPTEASLRHYA
jgi:hypothetical protein